MTRRDPQRSLSVPLKMLGNGQLAWSTAVPAPELLEPDSEDTLHIADVEVPLDSEVEVQFLLERISGGVSVSGQITAAWKGPCARCWLPLQGEARPRVREVFTADPREGEQYQLGTEHVNLVPMVRDAVLLELPIEAIPCPQDDPCPNLPSELTQSRDDADARRDPRWAALEKLRDGSTKPD